LLFAPLLLFAQSLHTLPSAPQNTLKDSRGSHGSPRVVWRCRFLCRYLCEDVERRLVDDAWERDPATSQSGRLAIDLTQLVHVTLRL